MTQVGEKNEVRDLTEAEQVALKEMTARAIVASGSEGRTDLKDIQRLYDALLGQPYDRDRARDVGALFGTFLAKLTEWEWQVQMSETYGSDFVILHHAPNSQQFVVSPITMIEYRLEDRREIDLRDVLDAIFDHYADEFGEFQFPKRDH